MNITCDNAELTDILGIPQAATQDGIYVEGNAMLRQRLLQEMMESDCGFAEQTFFQQREL